MCAPDFLVSFSSSVFQLRAYGERTGFDSSPSTVLRGNEQAIRFQPLNGSSFLAAIQQSSLDLEVAPFAHHTVIPGTTNDRFRVFQVIAVSNRE